VNAQHPPVAAHNGRVATRSASRPAADTSADEILAMARRWYEAELQRCACAHGARWPEHCEWVEGYLREELRQRLAARGWRPEHVVV